MKFLTVNTKKARLLSKLRIQPALGALTRTAANGFPNSWTVAALPPRYGSQLYLWPLKRACHCALDAKLFRTRRASIDPIDPHDCGSYFSLAISHEDYLGIHAFQEELAFGLRE